jgi:hypothetical protein
MKSISFRSEFIPKILNGKKTQTRRLIKPQPGSLPEGAYCDPYRGENKPFTHFTFWTKENKMCLPIGNVKIKGKETCHWNPPFGVPGDRLVIKQAPHITLEITNVRVERVSEISEEDARKEGVQKSWAYEMDTPDGIVSYSTFRAGFKGLWNSLYPGSWDRDDWVWVYEFKLLTREGCKYE